MKRRNHQNQEEERDNKKVERKWQILKIGKEDPKC